MVDRCGLSITTGRSANSIGSCITEAIERDEPLLVLMEPDPTVIVNGRTGRREGFYPLVRGLPILLADLPLSEARLFWASSALHLLSDGAGCRTARIEEGGGMAVIRKAYPVYPRQDLQRFGLERQAAAAAQLIAVEYWQAGRLLAWRLVEGDL